MAKKRNRFVNCRKYLHSIHLLNQNDVESHFQKLKTGFLVKIWEPLLVIFDENLIFLTEKGILSTETFLSER